MTQIDRRPTARRRKRKPKVPGRISVHGSVGHGVRKRHLQTAVVTVAALLMLKVLVLQETAQLTNLWSNAEVLLDLAAASHQQSDWSGVVHLGKPPGVQEEVLEDAGEAVEGKTMVIA
jgi:hypothetical protein